MTLLYLYLKIESTPSLVNLHQLLLILSYKLLHFKSVFIRCRRNLNIEFLISVSFQVLNLYLSVDLYKSQKRFDIFFFKKEYIFSFIRFQKCPQTKYPKYCMVYFLGKFSLALYLVQNIQTF